MDASLLEFPIPFPAKNAPPPWENWIITGDFESRAASNAVNQLVKYRLFSLESNGYTTLLMVFLKKYSSEGEHYLSASELSPQSALNFDLSQDYIFWPIFE